MTRPITYRNVVVQFFSVEPLDPDAPFEFDAPAVLAKVDALPREAGEAYLHRSFWERMLCTVEGSGDVKMLCAWAIDTLNAPYTERKGEVARLLLEDDEGTAEPTYVMFFGRVVALIRPTVKSPGHSMIASYINHFADAGCALVPVLTADAFERLKRDPMEVVSVRLRVKTKHLRAVRAANQGWAAALEAAAEPTGSTLVGLTLQTEARRERPAWWRRTQTELQRLSGAGALDLFETAAVDFTGNETVNLLEQRLTTRIAVDLAPGLKRLDMSDAARALISAYETARPSLNGQEP